jgi:hypothetical protein
MAGKTGFTSHGIHHCPLKADAMPQHEKNKSHEKGMQIVVPLYVFSTITAPLLPEPYQQYKTTPLRMSSYNDSFTDPPFKPPRTYTYEV